MIVQGYTLFLLFLLKTIDCGYSLEPDQDLYGLSLVQQYVLVLGISQNFIVDHRFCKTD